MSDDQKPPPVMTDGEVQLRAGIARRLGQTPVQAFIKPPPYEGLKLIGPFPDPLDVVSQNGVVEVLRDILTELSKDAETPDDNDDTDNDE
jgi:hypothetical protein